MRSGIGRTTLGREQLNGVAQRSGAKENYLLLVLSLSFLLGMGVAIAVYLGWKSALIAPGFNSVLSGLALLVCPPFILSLTAGLGLDSDLALMLTAGTIVLANAFLYAGVAAVGYFLVTLVAKRHARECRAAERRDLR